jgi:hypothetical protein
MNKNLMANSFLIPSNSMGLEVNSNEIHNLDSNCSEFAIIKSKAGLNNYKISVKEWVAKTNAIGLTAKAGRYGGTYAHKDIAFEFDMCEWKECVLWDVEEAGL